MSSKTRASTAAKKRSSSARSSNGKNMHVVPDQNGRWAVKASGSSRAARTFDTQAEAINAAKKAASKDAEVIIHGRGGRVRQTVSKSPADELMLRVWKSTHKADPKPARG